MRAYVAILISTVATVLATVDISGLDSKISISEDGTYAVVLGSDDLVNGEGFNFVGAPPILNTPDQRFLNNLRLANCFLGEGKDQLGEYTSYSQLWTHKRQDLLTTTFKVYRSVSIAAFEVTVHQTIKNCSIGNENKHVLSFPSFRVDEPKGSRKASFAVSGNMMSKYGILNEGLVEEWKPRAYIPNGFLGGLPIAIFDESLQSSLVMSPLDNFVVASHYHDIAKDAQWYRSGIIGTIDKLEAGFVYRSALVWTHGGVNAAFQEWGQALRTFYPISSTRPIDRDRTVEYLSYWTDNGAYYYYNPTGSYEDTLNSVLTYLKEEDIPIGAIQIDSWFYYRGTHNGVLNWAAPPEVFPSGMPMLLDYNIPIVAHNRYWDVDNVYDKANGGKYEFIGTDGKHAVPTEQRFWDDLIANGTKWGLAVYEQDWIYRQMTYVDDLMADTELAKNWLHQMGKAATANGVTIQYCGQTTRHLLAAIEIPAVTHARASGDYGKLNQWSISDANMIIHALGILPFKDVFWSTSVQPGNPYEWADHKPVEACPEIEALVSSLSTGPVAFGDGIGYANRDLLMRSCMANGKLLKPSRPAVTPDTLLAERVFRESGIPGVVMTTYTRVGAWRWDIVVGAIVLHKNVIAPQDRVDLTLADTSAAVVKFKRKNFSRVVPAVQRGSCVSHQVLKPMVEDISFFSSSEPINLEKEAWKCQYQMWLTAPVFSDGTVFLGELDKWVHVSPQRVLDIDDGGAPIVTIYAVKDEVVTLHFTHTDDLQSTYAVTCMAKEDGKMDVHLIR